MGQTILRFWPPSQAPSWRDLSETAAHRARILGQYPVSHNNNKGCHDWLPTPARRLCEWQWYRGYQRAVERLKWLSQILKQRARQLEICGFETFGEAVVHEGERMPGLIALAVFGEQACQGHR